MPDRETILREQTYKDDGLETERRVFYTLTDKDKPTQHRTAKLVALIVAALEKKGLLSEADLDEILFEAIN